MRHPLHRKWNTDRIAVSHEVLDECRKAGLDVTWADVEHIIGEYELLLLAGLRVRQEEDFKWELPHCFIVSYLT